MAHAGRAVVAVTTAAVKLAQKGEATAALDLMYEAQALESTLRQPSTAGARKRRV